MLIKYRADKVRAACKMLIEESEANSKTYNLFDAVKILNLLKHSDWDYVMLGDEEINFLNPYFRKMKVDKEEPTTIMPICGEDLINKQPVIFSNENIGRNAGHTNGFIKEEYSRDMEIKSNGQVIMTDVETGLKKPVEAIVETDYSFDEILTMIDVAIKNWHGDNENEKPLHEYLLMTKEEYKKYVQNNEIPADYFKRFKKDIKK